MTEARWVRRGRSLRAALAAGVSAVAVMSALAASPPARADTVIGTPSLGPQTWSGGNFTVTGGGLIAGGNTGVNASGGALGTLTNSGTIGGQTVGLTNSGTIGAIIDNAVLFGGNGLSNTALIGTLTNSGSIAGTLSAIANSGTIGTLVNTIGGTISGSTDAIKNSGSITAIVNSGTIGGGTIAVTITGIFAGVSIYNSGPTGITNTGSIGVITNSGVIAGNISSPGQALTIAGGSAGTVGTLTGTAGAIGTITAPGVSFTSGTLLLNDKVTGGVTNSGATLRVNAPISISGNYTQSGGALVIGVSPTTPYGELVVGGTATLTGATISIAGALSSGTYTLVSAGSISGSVTGPNAIQLSGLSGSTEMLTIVGNALELVPSVSSGYWPVNAPTTVAGTLSSGLGSISSTGTISVSGVGVTVVGSGTTLTNAGVISAGLTAVNIGTLVSLASLTNSGSIGGSVSGINNSGTIGALNNSRVISSRSVGINNDGSIGTLTNNGSISGIQALYNIGSITTLTNAIGGTISSGQWAIFNVGSIGVITNNGVIAGTIASPGQDLTIAGGSAGTVGTLTGSTPGSVGTISGSGVTFAAGTLLLNDHVTVGSGSGTVTNSANLQVNAPLSISGNYVQSGSGALVIGVATASSYGDLMVSGGATLTGVTVSVSSALPAGTITLVSANTGLVANPNSMTLAQPNGSTDTLTIVGKALELVIPSPPYWPVTGPVTTTGTLSNAAGSITSGTITSGGTISVSGVGVTVVGSGTTLTNYGVISAGVTGVAVGTLVNMASLANSGSISGSVSGINNSGTIGALNNTIGGSLAGIENFGSISTLTNSGTINGSTVAIGNGVGGSIGAIANSGTISSSSFAIANGSSIGAITNSGTIAGNISSSSQALTIAGGTGTVGTLTGYGGAGSIGTITSSGVTFASGTLQLNDHVSVGSGTVTNKANLLVNNTISIAGNYVQGASGTLVIGVSPNSSYGELVVTGTATLAGTVSITSPIGTGTIALVSATNLVGGNAVTLAPLPGGSNDVLTVVGNTLELVPPTPYWPVTITTTTAGTLGSGAASISGTGTITNVPVGVTVTGSGSALTNSGVIRAANSGVSVGLSASLASLTNSGLISGGNYAVGNFSDGLGRYNGIGTLTNSKGGIISGNAAAIFNYGNSSTQAFARNGIGAITNSGTISGGYEAIFNVSGSTIGVITNNSSSTINGGTVGIYNAGLHGAAVGTINNNAGAITGGTSGIENFGGYIGTINNVLAAITGGANGILNNSGTIDTLNNLFGFISGATAIANVGTVTVNGHAQARAMLTNSGIISGNKIGIPVGQASSMLADSATALLGSTATAAANAPGTIGTLTNSGTISGSNDAILNGSGGSLGVITNSGTIAGNIASTNQDLTIAGGASGTLGTLTGYAAGAIGSIISSGVTFTGGALLLNDHVTVASGSGTVTNNAHLQVNAPISISGNYVQSGSGALVIGVASPTSYGQLVVSGNASLTGHNIQIVPLNGTTLTPGESLTLISATGLTEDGIKANASGGLIATVNSNGLVTLSGTDWTVVTGSSTTTIGATTIGQGVGGNAQAVGSALGQLAGSTAYQPLLGSLSAMNQPQQIHALKQLGVGQVTPQLNDGAMIAAPMVSAVERHLWAVGSGGAAGAASATESRQGAWWGEVLGGAANRGSSAGADGYNGTSYGLLFGVDVPLSDDVTGGAAVNWLRNYASGKSDSSADSTTLDSYQLNGYGGWRPDGGPAFAQGLLSVGFDQYNQKRGIDVLGARATAKFNGNQYLARLGGGYDIALGDLTVTPLAALQAWRLENQAYTEKGAGLDNLAVSHVGLNGVESELGGRLSHRFQLDLGRIETDLQASWVHSYVHGPIALSASLGGGGFTETTSRVAADGARIVAGATLLRSDALSFTVEYDGEIHHGFMDNTGRLVFRSQF